MEVNEPTLDIETHFPSGIDCLFILVLWDVGKTEVKIGSFGTFEKGRPTFSPAVLMALALGIDDSIVPVAIYRRITEGSGSCGVIKARSPDNLQKLK